MQLFHHDLGGAGKPPLIVLHGLLGSSRNWLSTGRDLTKEFHVIALDARNHGKSPHADEMSYEAMMDDVTRWMLARGLPRAAFAGHSMGGKTAMLLACRRPELVTRLVIVDIAPKNYSWAAHRDEFAALNGLELGSLQSRAEAEMRFEGRVSSLAMRKFLTTNLERDEAGQWRWVVNLPVLTAALPILEKNCLDREDRFFGETLFVLGGRSRYAEPGDHEMIRRHFPAVRIEVIPESGHNPHMDAREEFVKLVNKAV